LNKVKFFQGLPPKERILTVEKEERLFAETPKHLRPILITAVNTVMRRGEILNLKWSDIDLSTGYIHVRKSKSGKSRKIPINETLRETLLEQQSQNFVSNSVSSGVIHSEKSNDYQKDTEVTRWIQDPVGECSWGFKSPLRHHRYQMAGDCQMDELTPKLIFTKPTRNSRSIFKFFLAIIITSPPWRFSRNENKKYRYSRRQEKRGQD
jgi:integrase-like protein